MGRIRNEPRKLHEFENVTHRDDPPKTAVKKFSDGCQDILVVSDDTETIPDGVLKLVTDESQFTVHTGTYDPLPFSDATFDAVIGFNGPVDLYSRPRTFHEPIRVIQENSSILYFASWVPQSDKATLDAIDVFDTMPYMSMHNDSETTSGPMKDLIFGSNWTVNPGQTGLTSFTA